LQAAAELGKFRFRPILSVLAAGANVGCGSIPVIHRAGAKLLIFAGISRHLFNHQSNNFLLLDWPKLLLSEG
jgi:hypothetical protein